MNHPSPRPPKDVPAGFFRFTRWSPDALETFPRWRAHFAAKRIRTLLVHAQGHVALFREGNEAMDEVTAWRKKRGGRVEADLISK